MIVSSGGRGRPPPLLMSSRRLNVRCSLLHFYIAHLPMCVVILKSLQLQNLLSYKRRISSLRVVAQTFSREGSSIRFQRRRPLWKGTFTFVGANKGCCRVCSLLFFSGSFSHSHSLLVLFHLALSIFFSFVFFKQRFWCCGGSGAGE